MFVSLIPFLAVILINVVVIGYLMWSGAKTKSGFFLIVSAMALVFWSGGAVLVRTFGITTNASISLSLFASLIIPANFLYFAMTRPTPMRDSWTGAFPLAFCFLPPVVLTGFQATTGASAELFNFEYKTHTVIPEEPFARAMLIYAVTWLASAVALLSIRYQNTTGVENVLAKHLIVSIIGPLFFAAVFWAASTQQSLMPSPALIFVMMAQISLIAVLRQEDLTSPRFLSRVVYNTTAVLVAFLLVQLMQEFYTWQAGSISMRRETGWMVMGASLILLLAARFSRVEGKLEELLFKRTAEYRKVVEETRRELREARERLRKTERLSVVGELSARVAHEIKNPLGPIRGYSQMMREKIESAEDFPHREVFLRYLEVIQEEADTIDRRVKGFLESAKGQEILQDSVQVRRLVDRCARLLRLEAEAESEAYSGHRVFIDVVEPERLEPILADAGRLEEALFNVARNALDEVQDREGAEVIFRILGETRNGVEGVLIVVEDNGAGFDLENRDRYFEPFYTEKAKGTGLGMPIVRSAVEAHSGVVQLDNRPGGGGRVKIWLPREPKANPGALLPKAGSQTPPESEKVRAGG